MTNQVPMDSQALVDQARAAIRAIKHDGGKEGMSVALAAIMKCSTAHNWNPNTCQDLIFKAWSKKENACATVRRRRRRIQHGLVFMVRSMFELESSVKEIEFPLLTVPESGHENTGLQVSA